MTSVESWGDKARAFLYALLVHLACILVMIIGLVWTRSEAPITIAGPVIEAELVGKAAAIAPPRAARKPAPAPKPEPAPPKPPEPKPEAPSEPQRTDAIEREKIAEMALLKAEQEKRA